MVKVGDLVELHGHVVCDVDIDLPIGGKCEITFVYPGGSEGHHVYEVRIPGVRETQIIPEACMTWLMNEAEERRSRFRPYKKEDMEAKEASFSVMKQSFKAGVQVVSADQLFPTPPALAERMVSLAGIGEGDRVLEPSAGTGNIVKAIRARGGIPYAVEINPKLASMVGAAVCADFLSLTSNDANYDAVVMNPPFKDAVDIAHILHAREFLKPGGRLVAICAGGPRQTEQLKPLAETWEPLPEGTFAGTGVHAVLLTIRRPA